MKKLILASQSPRRQEILKEAGFIFEIIPANIDEEKYETLTPLEMVKTLSKLKAEKISKDNTDAVVIGADTTVDLNGEIISKPKDLIDAKRILTRLSGTTHQIITGYTIISDDKSDTYFEITFVTFNTLMENQIDDYIKSENVLGFAGSYGIQDGADAFIKETRGDYKNIMGLPTSAINKLKEALE